MINKTGSDNRKKVLVVIDTLIRELESGGNAVRIACGRIILRMICRYDMPTQ